jgi:hypothetical protein
MFIPDPKTATKEVAKKKIWADLQRNIELSIQNFSLMGLGSGIGDPGGQKSSRSPIRIRNTAY